MYEKLHERIDLEKALQKLDKYEKALISMHYYYGYSARSIADMLAMSKRTIERDLTRVTNKLREYME